MKSPPRYPLLAELAGPLEGLAVATFGTHEKAQGQLASISDGRRHLWLLVWSLMTMRAERVESAHDLDLWRRRLTKSSMRGIAKLCALDGAKGLSRCLSRLGWRAMPSVQAYVELADLMATEDAAAKTLRHAERLDQRLVQLAPALARAGLSRQTTRVILQDKRIKLDEARRIIWRLEQLRDRSPADAERLLASLSPKRSPFDDETWARVCLPDAPWEGTKNLRPLRSADEIVAASREFGNCLSHRVGYVWRGESYFYQFRDLAIIELERVPMLGWEMSSCLGQNNRVLTAPEIQELEAEWSKAPPQICKVVRSDPYWDGVP